MPGFGATTKSTSPRLVLEVSYVHQHMVTAMVADTGGKQCVVLET